MCFLNVSQNSTLFAVLFRGVLLQLMLGVLNLFVLIGWAVDHVGARNIGTYTYTLCGPVNVAVC